MRALGDPQRLRPAADPPSGGREQERKRDGLWERSVAALWTVNHVVVGLRGASPRLAALPAALAELERLAREVDGAPEVARAVEGRSRELGRHLSTSAASLSDAARRLTRLADELARRREGREG